MDMLDRAVNKFKINQHFWWRGNNFTPDNFAGGSKGISIGEVIDHQSWPLFILVGIRAQD
jgi:hypothetical protein